MSGTVFVPRTIVTKEWLNASDVHDHSDPTTPGAGGDIRPTLDKIYTATVGGTANAITLTHAIAQTAHVANRLLTFEAAATNTGAVTVNVDSLGALSLLKAGGLALEAGDIKAGGLITIAYDGATYTVISGLDNVSPRIGSTGSTTFRNRVINGSMRVDQENEGVAQTFTAGGALAYCVDQWYGYCTGANVTGQRVQLADGSYRYRFTGSGSGTNTGIGFGQRMEAINTYDMAGQTCTLAVNLYSTSLTSVTWTAYYATTADTFGTLSVPTKTSIATGTFTITSTDARYTVNIAIPAAATTGIEVVFTTGTLASPNTLHIGRVQFELGTVATPFERMDISALESRCRRYLWIWGKAASAWGWSCYNSNGASTVNSLQFPVSMRVTPTASLVGTPTYVNASTGAVDSTSRFGGRATFTTTSTGSCAMNCSGANNYFKFDARM